MFFSLYIPRHFAKLNFGLYSLAFCAAIGFVCGIQAAAPSPTKPSSSAEIELRFGASERLPQAYEKWVDPVAGNNSNPGTVDLPYASLFYAIDQGKNYLSDDDMLTVHVVPSASLSPTDYIRLVPQHKTTTIIVKSALPGVNFLQTNSVNHFIGVFSQPTCKLRIEDATVICNRVIMSDGPNSSGNRTCDIELSGNCIFTHGRNHVEEAMRLAVPPEPNNLGSVKTESGCAMIGWQSICNFQTGSLHTIELDGLVFNSGPDTQVGVSILAGVSVILKNSTISMTNSSVANRLQFESSSAHEITIEENSMTFNGSSGLAIHIKAPSVGTSTCCAVKFNRNSILLDNGEFVMIGKDFNANNTREQNDAVIEKFSSVEIRENYIQQNAVNGSALYLTHGSNNCIAEGNYIRVFNVGDSTNVHQVYLYANDVQFRNNLLAASVLAFGYNQVIEENVIVANRCVLLGGTQAGSTPLGGGNNYVIRNNILVSTRHDCIGDYAWNGAYPSRLGPLLAEIDHNKYVVLDEANGIARYTTAGLTASTLEQLRNLWAYSSLVAGSSSNVWGVESNQYNDQNSQLITADPLLEIQAICARGVALTRNDLLTVKNILRDPAVTLKASVFYPGTVFDNGDLSVEVDSSKQLALEGTSPETLGFLNLTNTVDGINGLLFEIDYLANPSQLDQEDFRFQWSPSNLFSVEDHPPFDWQEVPIKPTIRVVVDSQFSIFIRWPKQTIMNRWLRVTVNATSNTGLAKPSVYYIGHLLGKTTGTEDGIFTVSFADIIPIRVTVGSTVGANSISDIDKNGVISFGDISAMRGNVGAQLSQLSVP